MAQHKIAGRPTAPHCTMYGVHGHLTAHVVCTEHGGTHACTPTRSRVACATQGAHVQLSEATVPAFLECSVCWWLTHKHATSGSAGCSASLGPPLHPAWRQSASTGPSRSPAQRCAHPPMSAHWKAEPVPLGGAQVWWQLVGMPGLQCCCPLWLTGLQTLSWAGLAVVAGSRAHAAVRQRCWDGLLQVLSLGVPLMSYLGPWSGGVRGAQRPAVRHG